MKSGSARCNLILQLRSLELTCLTFGSVFNTVLKFTENEKKHIPLLFLMTRFLCVCACGCICCVNLFTSLPVL